MAPQPSDCANRSDAVTVAPDCLDGPQAEFDHAVEAVRRLAAKGIDPTPEDIATVLGDGNDLITNLTPEDIARVFGDCVGSDLITILPSFESRTDDTGLALDQRQVDAGPTSIRDWSIATKGGPIAKEESQGRQFSQPADTVDRRSLKPVSWVVLAGEAGIALVLTVLFAPWLLEGPLSKPYEQLAPVKEVGAGAAVWAAPMLHEMAHAAPLRRQDDAETERNVRTVSYTRPAWADPSPLARLPEPAFRDQTDVEAGMRANADEPALDNGLVIVAQEIPPPAEVDSENLNLPEPPPPGFDAALLAPAADEAPAEAAEVTAAGSSEPPSTTAAAPAADLAALPAPLPAPAEPTEPAPQPSIRVELPAPVDPLPAPLPDSGFSPSRPVSTGSLSALPDPLIAYAAELAHALRSAREQALEREREKSDQLAREIARMKEEIGVLRARNLHPWGDLVTLPLPPHDPPLSDVATGAAEAAPPAAPALASAPALEARIPEPSATGSTQPPPVVESRPLPVQPPAAPIAAAPPSEAVMPGHQRLLDRASALIKAHDISGARLVLERAVSEGSAKAAYLLAQTYDPQVLRNWTVIGLRGDAVKANEFYALAKAGGFPDAQGPPTGR